MGRRVRSRVESRRFVDLYPISFDDIRTVVLEDGKEVEIVKAISGLFTYLYHGKLYQIKDPDYTNWIVNLKSDQIVEPEP